MTTINEAYNTLNDIQNLIDCNQINSGDIIEINIYEENLKSYTKKLGNYSIVKLGDSVEGTTCSCCNKSFKIGEHKRILNKCNHCFHKKCIDKFLFNNRYCPICCTTY